MFDYVTQEEEAQRKKESMVAILAAGMAVTQHQDGEDDFLTIIDRYTGGNTKISLQALCIIRVAMQEAGLQVAGC